MTVPRSIRERRVFIDSSAYLALVDASDANHDAATETFRWLAAQRYRVYTPNVRLVECHALILTCVNRSVAARFLQNIDAGTTVIVRVRASDKAHAKQIIYQYRDKDFSFNDALSFVVMERLGINYAFTFDSDFAQYGFSVLNARNLP